MLSFLGAYRNYAYFLADLRQKNQGSRPVHFYSLKYQTIDIYLNKADFLILTAGALGLLPASSADVSGRTNRLTALFTQ